MHRIIISRALDGDALLEQAQMLNHHIRIECVGVVIVEVASLLIAQLVVPLVVIIVAQNGDILAESVLQRLYECRFAAAGAARNANDDNVRVSHFSLLYRITPSTSG